MGPKWTGRLKDARSGDAIPFRDTEWEGPRASGRGRYTAALNHHTAIVYESGQDGRPLKCYHQNVGGKKVVTGGSLKLDDLKAGWIRIYRANPK